MKRLAYKYLSPHLVDRIFSDPGKVTLKCSLPSGFNDPYELFLNVGLEVGPELLAFHRDAVGEMPQLPTTCFSKSPIVVPMWAHYAENHQGFVIGIDEEVVTEAYESAYFHDVNYRDQADVALGGSLARAFGTGKPRHTHWLQQAVMHSAYFSKTTCWTYEQERRLVVGTSDTRTDLLLLDVPRSAVSAIIVGARCQEALQVSLQGIAAKLDCPIYRVNIAKSSATPFLSADSGAPCTFNGETIAPCDWECETCREPVGENTSSCCWCAVTSENEHDAAIRNPYRILARHGLLERTLESYASLDRKHAGRRNGGSEDDLL